MSAARRTGRASWSPQSGTPACAFSTRNGTSRAAAKPSRARPTGPWRRAAAPGGCTSRPTRCCTSRAPPSSPRRCASGTATHASRDCWSSTSTSSATSTPSRRTGTGTAARCGSCGWGGTCARTRTHRDSVWGPGCGVRARVTGALMFHYGWARALGSVRQKLEASRAIFRGAALRPEQGLDERLGWTPLLRRFTGTHPRAARDWVAARRVTPRAIGARQFRLHHVRYYLSDWIERLTGVRLFEYRNYVEV